MNNPNRMKDMKIESVALYKCIRKLLSVIFLLPLFYACGSDNGFSQEEPQLDAPQLVSSIPANGAVDVSDADLNVVLTYDQNVIAPSSGHSQVVVAGATVDKVSANLKNVTI